MRRPRTLTMVLLTGTLALAMLAWPMAQGVFDPTRDVAVGGQWTFTNPSPWVFGPSTTTFKTTVTPTTPTANRTITLPDATDTLVGKATTDTLTNKTLTAPVMSGSVTGTYTLAGTPTITSPILSSFTNTGTETMPSATGGIPVSLFCGSTGVGNQTCSVTAAAATTKVYSGNSTLSANAAVITFSPAFNSTTYVCVANDITTRANPVQMLSTSNATATITNTTGASDVINWVCVGQ